MIKYISMDCYIVFLYFTVPSQVMIPQGPIATMLSTITGN